MLKHCKLIQQRFFRFVIPETTKKNKNWISNVCASVESQQNIILLMTKIQKELCCFSLNLSLISQHFSLEYFVVSEIFKNITDSSHSSWEGRKVCEHITW